MLLAGVVLIVYLICLTVVLKLDADNEKQRRKMELEKLKIDLELEAMKRNAKLTYAEKQRLNFAMGRHWKR